MEEIPNNHKLLDEALALHQQGKLANAEPLYRQILAKRPNNFQALHHLGVLKCQQSDNEEGVRLILAALQIEPFSVDALLNLALGLTNLNRLADAVGAFDRVLALSPRHIHALFRRAALLVKLDRAQDAIAGFDRLLTLDPRHVDGRLGRGVALGMLDRNVEALAEFDAALLVAPRDFRALASRGVALVRLGDYSGALAAYDAALAVHPNDADICSKRATALAHLGRCQEAVADCDRALQLRPRFAEALVTRGSNLSRLLRHTQAIADFDAALALSPGDALALYNRGNSLASLNRHEEAIASYDAALELKPAYPEALYNRGNLLRAANRLPEAIASYERSLALRPDHPYAFGNMAHCELALCNWDKLRSVVNELTARVREERSIISPFVSLVFSSDPAIQLQCATSFVRDQVKCAALPARSAADYRSDKLRIAYLSADYRAHPVGGLIPELIARHDRTRFEVIGISTGPDDGSELRARLTAAFDRFHDVRSYDDVAAARLIQEFGVHIAVDLTGHTEHARPQILGYRPAPVQVSYLGYAGTSGAPYMDYVIADSIVLPLDQQASFSESIVHLPDTFFVNDPNKEISSRVPSRQEVGLPDNGLVFCCFNASYKLSPAVFDVWMRLLRAIEGSVLWLSQPNDLAAANLRREAVRRGVDPDRLVFAEKVPRLADHLARHRLADLFLDTLPYNAHTTASEALWTGLPVITCKGTTFAGRVGASLLTAARVPELITASLQEYEALALRLARDSTARTVLRRKLENERLLSPLFDADRFRQHIEQAFITMWENQRLGKPPASFSVPHAAIHPAK
jgi:predicted O-linked N-acetylglucosamine transferase (SPINDLY family)